MTVMCDGKNETRDDTHTSYTTHNIIIHTVEYNNTITIVANVSSVVIFNMMSWLIILVIVVAVVFGVIFAVLGTKYRKRYLAHLRKMSRRKWKKEHQKTLRGNFILTYDTPIEDTYLIEKGAVLGQGSFGIVVLGKHRETGNQYAIKFINKNSEERKRLERELRMLKDVDHPNIVGLFAVYDTDDQV
jgi:hypothetical protein